MWRSPYASCVSPVYIKLTKKWVEGKSSDRDILNSCAIKSLTFNQGGTQLVSVAEDGIARLWSLFSDRYQQFQVPQNKIIGAGFDRNGQLLLVTNTLDNKIAYQF